MLRHQPLRLFLGCTLIALFLVPLQFAGLSVAKTKLSLPNGRVAAFTLKDFRGKQWSLSSFKNSRLVVVAFLGTECPIARLYAARLTQMANEYSGRGVAFIGIVSNRQDSITEMAHFARVHRIGFPILKDLNNKVADQFDAERVPEVYVLDKHRKVRYRGRIDDQYSYGVARPKVKQEYLVAALKELLAGRPVTTSRTEAAGCRIGRMRAPAKNAEVTYSKQICRILQARCVRCHRPGAIAPFALTKYDEVAGWAEMIEEVVREQRMPPWHANPKHGKFKNDARLTNEEKQLIYKWVAAGAPKGDPRNLPKPAVFARGWQIGKPDQIIYMSEKPCRVPAEGEVDYKYFAVDPGWQEDKWIQAVECRPGNRAVVHHIDVKARSDGAKGYETFYQVAGMNLGNPPQTFPKGFARLVPAGAKLVFEVHYTAIGREQFDRSCIGVIFADPKTVKHPVMEYAAGNVNFAIPAGARRHKVEASLTLEHDALLLSLTPHMHARGKSFRYTAFYPNGRKEILLDVPHYDFHWQNIYELTEPKRIPKGTKIHCVARFDNSADNLANPDPTKTVRFGDQSWDEMMFGFMDVTVVTNQVISTSR